MTPLGQLVRAILRSVLTCVRRMSPNPYGNPSSRKDRKKCRELLTCAMWLREAAEALEAACSEMTDVERLPSKWDRRSERPKAQTRSRQMEREARKKAKEALELAARHLEP